MSLLPRCAVIFALSRLASSMRLRTRAVSDAKAIADYEANAEKTSCPRFPHVTSASAQCGQAMYGTLVVGCVSAEGLYKGSFFDKSDPYCRVGLSDKSDTESKGTIKKYKKFVARSESGATAYKKNDLNPSWNTAFAFDLVCPATRAHLWQLEIAIKDKNIAADGDLGYAYVKLDDILAGQASGEQILKIVTNKADTKDKRGGGKGKVKLFIQHCARGNHSCVSSAAGKSGASEVKSSFKVECGQSCHSHMKKVISVVDSALHQVKEAIRQDSLANHYDDMGDRHEDEGNQAAEDHYDRLEDQAEEATKRAWQHAVQKIGSVHQELQKTSSTTCPGSSFVASVAEAAAPARMTLGKKFKSSQAKGAITKLNAAISNLNQVKSCLEQRWWEGETLPNSHAVSGQCQAYFGR